jgi:hypothetical protein
VEREAAVLEVRAMKYATARPYTDPEKAAHRLLEHAHAFEPVQDGRFYIEKLNGPFLYIDKGSPAEYSAGLKLAIERGWLEMHDSGTYVKFTAAGADRFALAIWSVCLNKRWSCRCQPENKWPRRSH